MRFRNTSKKPQKSYRELAIRLQDLQKKLMKERTSIELINQVLVKEQLINIMPPDLKL